jgi:hypothetical protein
VKVIQKYTLTLNLVEEKMINVLKNLLIYKAQQIMMTSKIPRNVYIFLDDGASGVQVRDIE